MSEEPKSLQKIISGRVISKDGFSMEVDWKDADPMSKKVRLDAIPEALRTANIGDTIYAKLRRLTCGKMEFIDCLVSREYKSSLERIGIKRKYVS